MVTDKSNRVDRFRPNETDEQFLSSLNDRLAEAISDDAAPQLPTLFISGGPRSGTTFLAQCVSQAFHVAHIDHLAAKFWQAPVTGFKLSRSLFAQRGDSSFRSEYGRTATTTDIHGFHYFWMEQLGIEDPRTLFAGPEDRGISPRRINGHLASLQDAAGASFVFKGYYPSYFIPWFTRHVPKCVFILIRRDPMAQGRSIYRAREAFMQSVTDWWSMLPPEFDELKILSTERQIAGQIFGMRRFFARQMRQSDANIITITHEELTTDLACTMDRIGEEVYQLTGDRLRRTDVTPEVRASGTTVPPDVERRLVEAIEHYSAWDEPWNPQ